ncbi:MAG: alkaline phosphatase family protein [Pseudothermotoga sp.]
MNLEKIAEDIFKPSYDRFSVVNIANSILKHFGCEALHAEYPFDYLKPGLFEKADKVVLFLIDALGLESLKTILQREPLFEQQNILTATSVFPTTTSASIASLLTASEPIEHGILGYTLYLRELGALVNMIELSSPTLGKVPSTMQSRDILFTRTIFERLVDVGVKGYVLTSKNIRGSGFSNLVHVGASIKSYQSFGNLFFKLDEILQQDEKLFAFVYWGLLDSIGHKIGVNSPAFQSELYWLLKMIQKEVLAHLQENVLLLIMGDHGQIYTPWEKEIWWSWKDEISSFFLVPPGGEMRMMHIYTREPQKVVEYIQRVYSDQIFALTKEQSIQLHLFGDSQASEKSLDRIGDVVLIAKSNYSFYFKFTGREESLKSKHGGLSLEELMIPVVVFRR